MTPDAPLSITRAATSGARRRAALQIAVAAAAATAGAGFAWWKFQPHKAVADAHERFWCMSFATPAGATLSMAALRGKLLVVNFWATWCPPCVEELPLLDRFYRENSSNNVQVIGLAVDQPGAVQKFLERTPVTFPVGMAGLGGTDLGKSMGNAAGGLPFTIVFSPDGRVLDRKMGQVSAEDLKRWRQKA